ncbi:MAG: Crp/Fnr family transcriptional regulator [Saprospiraceae bacterium]|nr:Crp/Fnr family transcriptional regulator [Saprospiraceae bacterium]
MSMILQEVYRHPMITASQFEEISHLHQRVKFRKGEMIVNQGDISSKYYCIETGLIRSFALSHDAQEITTGFFEKGSIAIEVSSVFLQTPNKENLQALSDVTCWEIKIEDFQRLYHAIAGFREWGQMWMTRQLLCLKTRSLSMITDSAKTRYLNFISESQEVIRFAPLKYIASYLGITDTSLSRIRKEMCRA